MINPIIRDQSSIRLHRKAGSYALRTEAVEVTYPNGTRALNPTSLDFAPGDFIVLLGSSGAGKSTLLRSLTGLVRPTTGRVIAHGLGNIADSGTLRRHRCQTSMNTVSLSTATL